MEFELEKIDIPGYEEVYKMHDASVGLMGVIAIHSTKIGPAVGGCRIFPYPSFDDALTDALRLSKGMTQKSLLMDGIIGGGKAVIIADPTKPIPGALLRSFAKAVHSLNGRYFTAEDSGMNQDRLRAIRKDTPYVLGVEEEDSSGNPCPSTAWGTLRGIQATMEEITGSISLRGKVVAIQGLGFVGSLLAELLFWEGADLVVTDICPEKIKHICKRFDATAVAPEFIYDVPCDIFSPCALGAILNSRTIPRLKCKGIAGSSNNQLEKESDGELLVQRKILYAPDIIINPGGLINVQMEIGPHGYKPTLARDSINKIYDRTKTLFKYAKEKGVDPGKAAVMLADEKLELEFSKDSGGVNIAKIIS